MKIAITMIGRPLALAACLLALSGCELIAPQSYQIEYVVSCDGTCDVTAHNRADGSDHDFQVEGDWNHITTMQSGDEAYIHVWKNPCYASDYTPPDVRILQGGEEVGLRDSDGQCVVVVSHQVGRR